MSEAQFVGLERFVHDFRRWVLSDWRSPTTRAMLAEYHVRCAMGADGEPAEESGTTFEDRKTVTVGRLKQRGFRSVGFDGPASEVSRNAPSGPQPRTPSRFSAAR